MRRVILCAVFIFLAFLTFGQERLTEYNAIPAHFLSYETVEDDRFFMATYSNFNRASFFELIDSTVASIPFDDQEIAAKDAKIFMEGNLAIFLFKDKVEIFNLGTNEIKNIGTNGVHYVYYENNHLLTNNKHHFVDIKTGSIYQFDKPKWQKKIDDEKGIVLLNDGYYIENALTGSKQFIVEKYVKEFYTSKNTSIIYYHTSNGGMFSFDPADGTTHYFGKTNIGDNVQFTNDNFVVFTDDFIIQYHTATSIVDTIPHHISSSSNQVIVADDQGQTVVKIDGYLYFYQNLELINQMAVEKILPSNDPSKLYFQPPATTSKNIFEYDIQTQTLKKLNKFDVQGWIDRVIHYHEITFGIGGFYSNNSKYALCEITEDRLVQPRFIPMPNFYSGLFAEQLICENQQLTYVHSGGVNQVVNGQTFYNYLDSFNIKSTILNDGPNHYFIHEVLDSDGTVHQQLIRFDRLTQLSETIYNFGVGPNTSNFPTFDLKNGYCHYFRNGKLYTFELSSLAHTEVDLESRNLQYAGSYKDKVFYYNQHQLLQSDFQGVEKDLQFSSGNAINYGYGNVRGDYLFFNTAGSDGLYHLDGVYHLGLEKSISFHNLEFVTAHPYTFFTTNNGVLLMENNGNLGTIHFNKPSKSYLWNEPDVEDADVFVYGNYAVGNIQLYDGHWSRYTYDAVKDSFKYNLNKYFQPFFKVGNTDSIFYGIEANYLGNQSHIMAMDESGISTPTGASIDAKILSTKQHLRHGRWLIFSLKDDRIGEELAIFDMETNKIFQYDINLGIDDGWPLNFCITDGVLYFTAIDYFYGRQIYGLRLDDLISNVDATPSLIYSWSVYPNPTSDIVHFDQTSHVTAFNSQGQKIGEAHNVSTYDMTNYPTGIYFLRNQEGKIAKVVKR